MFVLTSEMEADSPAGQGSSRAGTEAAVSALHTHRSLAICGGGRDEQGAVGQRADGLSLGEHRAIPQPGHVERWISGPQVAVQQKRAVRLQNHIDRTGTTAQLY